MRGQKKKAKKSAQVFCAFCLSERPYLSKKHIGLKDFLLIVAFSILVQLFVWMELHFGFLLILASLVLISEVTLLLRWRILLACPRCGFDPQLYSRDPELARQRVLSQIAEFEKRAPYTLDPHPLHKLKKRQVEHRRPHLRRREREVLAEPPVQQRVSARLSELVTSIHK